MLSINDKFPEFNLTAVTSSNAFEQISNDTYATKWKVFFFYPKNFTFICPTELIRFNEMYDDFANQNTQIMGCSTDSEFSHLAWKKHNTKLSNLKYSLLSDIKHDLSSKLGILSEGVSQRATFVVDLKDEIRFVMVTDMSVGRNVKEVLRVVQALQANKLCGCEWKPGDKYVSDLND